MIPKIIHYCWFGRGPLPELAVKCIASWKQYLPAYEIKEWNEGNFDVNIISYTREAYAVKKYAFVSDYARFWILYHYGGLYFDTDVEIIRPIDDIIARGAFMGCERDGHPSGIEVNPGLGIGAEPGLGLYKEMLDKYATMHFLGKGQAMNETTVVQYTTSLLRAEGLADTAGIQCIGGVYIYPKEYFCPLDLEGNMHVTTNTRSIHHFMASWKRKNCWEKRWRRLKDGFKKLLPAPIVEHILEYKKERRDRRREELFNARL